MTDDPVALNGVDADTGGYLFPPLRPADVAEVARGGDGMSAFLGAMSRRHVGAEVAFDIDTDDLVQAGWGVVFAEDTAPEIVAALRRLLDLRKSQAGKRYKELVVHKDEDATDFLWRHGMGPDPADPRKVPYYLLIVGPPTSIPFTFQYQLDVQYAVGRIDFGTPDEYRTYARQVADAEERPRCALPVHLFGTRNPGDSATSMSASRLVEPLARELAELAPGIEITTDIGAAATKTRLAQLMTEGPAVLFTATHGLGGARDIQGALVCQDWPGPMEQATPVSADQYLAAADIAGPLAPRVVFSFACYSAGTPEQPYVARLPQRMLTSGVLAFVGHIDRAWGYSFLWKGAQAQITSMVSSMLSIHKGRRLGSAMEAINSRWAAIATDLTTKLDQMRDDHRLIDDRVLAWLWTASNDARNYVVIGDPAVRAC